MPERDLRVHAASVGVVSHGSLVNASIAALPSMAVAVRIGTEERLMIERYPENVARADRTKRVIPFVV